MGKKEYRRMTYLFRVARAGIEPATSRFSVARSYQLSYPASKISASRNLLVRRQTLATWTGLEPATSAVTGRRANQLRYQASLYRYPRKRLPEIETSAPNGIRTRVTAVKGRCPRPLDDGDV